MEYIIKSNSYRLLKDKIKELINNIDKDNVSYFDLNVDSLKDILSECNYTSLFDDKKAIIVSNANIFGTKFEYKDELEMLESYLNNPNINTTLIFLTDSISLKKKCVKKIKDNNNLLELNIDDKNIKDKIRDYLKNNNYKIENNAFDAILVRLNNNYDYILNELDKVIVMKKDYLITLDDINKYTINIENDNIFDFVDVIIKKDIKKVLNKLNKFIINNQEPAILLSNVATQYRLIYCVKNLIKEGFSEQDIAIKLNIHPYRVKLAREKVYNYSNQELKEKLLSIGNLDEKVKLGMIDKYNALKLFLVNL